MNELKSILLVEDNPNDREMTLSALAEHHLMNEIVTAEDGEQALDYLYQRGAYQSRPPGNPIVIFLDLKMPKVDGLEVLRTIKGDRRFKSIPIVMLTSSREEQDLVRSYELGTNAYVVKPVGFKEFIDAIKQVGAFWAVHNEPPPGSVRRGL